MFKYNSRMAVGCIASKSEAMLENCCLLALCDRDKWHFADENFQRIILYVNSR